MAYGLDCPNSANRAGTIKNIEFDVTTTDGTLTTIYTLLSADIPNNSSITILGQYAAVQTSASPTAYAESSGGSFFANINRIAGAPVVVGGGTGITWDERENATPNVNLALSVVGSDVVLQANSGAVATTFVWRFKLTLIIR